MKANEFLTKKEVKDLLKVSYPTLNYWNSTGVLPFIKIGNKLIRYRKSDIETLTNTKLSIN